MKLDWIEKLALEEGDKSAAARALLRADNPQDQMEALRDFVSALFPQPIPQLTNSEFKQRLRRNKPSKKVFASGVDILVPVKISTEESVFGGSNG